MWGLNDDLYIGDGPTIRRLNLVTHEVSTVSLRAGSGQTIAFNTLNQASGLAGLWGDGSSLYVTDIGVGRVRRIALSTGLSEDFAGSIPFARGLTGTGDSLFVGASQRREIYRVDRNTQSVEKFAELAGPTDPPQPPEFFLISSKAADFVRSSS
jgi:hypothetical protein